MKSVKPRLWVNRRRRDQEDWILREESTWNHPSGAREVHVDRAPDSEECNAKTSLKWPLLRSPHEFGNLWQCFIVAPVVIESVGRQLR